MTFFISGGAKNGKSALAQNLAVGLANGGKRYYIATMIPTDSEDYDRIKRHIADRDGLDFKTVECFKNINDCLAVCDKNATFLLDSVTAMLQNAMFDASNNYEPDLSAAKRCGDEMVSFARTVKNVIFVSDCIYSDCERYSKTTEQYREALADIDKKLAAVCDSVIEVSGGIYTVHKGELI